MHSKGGHEFDFSSPFSPPSSPFLQASVSTGLCFFLDRNPFRGSGTQSSFMAFSVLGSSPGLSPDLLGVFSSGKTRYVQAPKQPTTADMSPNSQLKNNRLGQRTMGASPRRRCQPRGSIPFLFTSWPVPAAEAAPRGRNWTELCAWVKLAWHNKKES